MDVKFGLLARTRNKKADKKNYSVQTASAEVLCSTFFEKYSDTLQFEVDKKSRVVISLPATMNFSTEYEATIAHLMAIRSLVTHAKVGGGLRLKRVAFANLKVISTSAALVLTAELAKWEDASRLNLRPDVNDWDDDIFRQFCEIGFFDLFTIPPEKQVVVQASGEGRHLVNYIKGGFREHDKPRILQERLRHIVGNEIDNWAFLHTGLIEAIINVTHHAYPDGNGFVDRDKNWYMTGSYDKSTRQLKIVFYDQGITIPKSLPASDWGEKILDYLSKAKILEGKNDSHLISAAMEMSRTRTNQADRGKGLQDILQFVKQRNQGYLVPIQ